jgi:hypothetical protein
MARTLANWRSVVTHALDGSPAVIVTSADVTANLIVNDAGKILTGKRRWNWYNRAASLNLTISQSYVAMPTDFSEFKAITYNGGSTLVRLVSLEQIDQIRALGIASTAELYAAITQPGQTVVTAAPAAPRLEITPTPAASATGALLLRYRAGWTALSGDTDVANIPEQFEPLFEELVRAVAKGREDGDLPARVGAVFASDLWRSAVDWDAMAAATPVSCAFPPSLGTPITFIPTTGGVADPA